MNISVASFEKSASQWLPDMGHATTCMSWPLTGAGTVWICLIVSSCAGISLGKSLRRANNAGYHAWAFHTGSTSTIVVLCLLTIDKTLSISAHGGLAKLVVSHLWRKSSVASALGSCLQLTSPLAQVCIWTIFSCGILTVMFWVSIVTTPRKFNCVGSSTDFWWFTIRILGTQRGLLWAEFVLLHLPWCQEIVVQVCYHLAPQLSQWCYTGRMIFVKILGAEDRLKGRHLKWQVLPFQWKATYFRCSLWIGMASFRSIFTIQSPSSIRSFMRWTPSILKCSLQIYLFGVRRSITGL